MAEIIGVASGVITLVESGIKVYREVKKALDSIDGTPNWTLELDSRLKTLVAILTNIQDASHGTERCHGPNTLIQHLIHDTKTNAERLQALLRNLNIDAAFSKLPSRESKTRSGLRKIHKSYKIGQEKNRLQNASKSLETSVQNLYKEIQFVQLRNLESIRTTVDESSQSLTDVRSQMIEMKTALDGIGEQKICSDNYVATRPSAYLPVCGNTSQDVSAASQTTYFPTRRWHKYCSSGCPCCCHAYELNPTDRCATSFSGFLRFCASPLARCSEESCRLRRNRFCVLFVPGWSVCFGFEVGDRSILPSISYHPLIDSTTSEAYKIGMNIARVRTWKAEPDIRRLQRLFDERKASPHDTFENGETLLSLCWMSLLWKLDDSAVNVHDEEGAKFLSWLVEDQKCVPESGPFAKRGFQRIDSCIVHEPHATLQFPSSVLVVARAGWEPMLIESNPNWSTRYDYNLTKNRFSMKVVKFFSQTFDDLLGPSALLNAILKDDLATAKRLIEMGKYRTDERTARRDETALHLAIFSPLELFELVLNAGFDMEARNRSDMTPLETCVAHARTEHAVLLLARGASPAARAPQTVETIIPCRVCIPYSEDELEASIACARRLIPVIKSTAPQVLQENQDSILRRFVTLSPRDRVQEEMLARLCRFWLDQGADPLLGGENISIKHETIARMIDEYRVRDVDGESDDEFYDLSDLDDHAVDA